jgi:hypothetical protein
VLPVCDRPVAVIDHHAGVVSAKLPAAIFAIGTISAISAVWQRARFWV